jgi:hypothetical protein
VIINGRVGTSHLNFLDSGQTTGQSYTLSGASH